MNTAIDQQVERYLKENGQWEEAKKRIENHFKELNAEQPAYLEKLPGNHNSFGLHLLGITGDLLVEPEVYQNIKDETNRNVRGTVQVEVHNEDHAQYTYSY